MKLLALKIDGYGIWSGLRVERFSDGLNVLYGPNEAGKTTLLQFIRSMLYGFSESRRHYFPPVHGGRPGGMAEVDSPQGHYEIARHWLPESVSEETILTASDGMRQGDHLVKAMLSEVDEATFNNVFAVELREMQELGALGDTAAAELLYNLTAGLDRVSLVEVLRELEISRNRMLDVGGNPCLMANLQSRREKIRAEIDDLGGLTRRFGLLVGERAQLERDLARLEEERNHVERQTRALELALALRDRWTKRSSIDNQLGKLGPIAPLPEKMLKRLDALNAKLQQRKQRIAELRKERSELRSEAAEIALNEDLLRQFARIEALQEQESWFADIQKQIGDLEAEIALLESEHSSFWQQLGLKNEAVPQFENLSARSLASLRSPAKNLHRMREAFDEAQNKAQAAQETADSLAKQASDALAARNENNLNEAMDKAGHMVSQYRRRLQIDERLDQLGRHQAELDEQSHRAVERQLLPTSVLAALGTVFVLGVLLISAGLVPSLVTSSAIGLANWLAAGLGVIGIAGACVTKVSLEKSNTKRLDDCQKQLALVQIQIKQAKEERDELDAQLPRGGGPLVSRLEAAEKDLAELETLVPLETTRKTAVQTASAALERAVQTEAEFKAARRKWRDSLSAAGLPVELSARQVRQLASRWDGMSENMRRLAQCREEWERRCKEAEGMVARVDQVAADSRVELPPGDPLVQLKHLASALADGQAAAARRETALGRLKALRQSRARHEEVIGRLNHRRRRLFFEAGVEDEESFRQRTAESVRAEALRRERETLSQDITAVLGKQCTEDAIRELLDGVPAAELESRGNLLRDRLAILNSEVRERLEKRGQLTAQIQTLADDRQLPRLQLDLACVERQMAEATKRWQVLAVVCRLLEDIRTSYERERQPETLKEASIYLAKLTQGRYCRVWTPLGEKTLRVDDGDGHNLPVESLSRGTREQLFLSLRLALAASYARRGAVLPMVLDDILVNFDADRAFAAAEVLRDFAAAGHQLLVCTCHEHIERIFGRLDVPLNRLPSSTEPGGAVISFHRVAVVEEPKREKLRPSPRRKAAAKPEVIVEEPPEIPEAEAEEDELVPIFPPRKQKRSRSSSKKKLIEPPKKAAKPSGVFDVDFFDNDEETDKTDEDLEDIDDNDDDSSLWQDNDAFAGDEDEEDGEEENQFDDENIEEGNGELT